MAKLIFITHPDVIIDPKIPVDRWILSEEGILDTKRLSKMDFWKDIDHIYCSTEQKSFQTAYIISKKHSIELTEDSDLREINRNSTGFLEKTEYKKGILDFYKSPDKSFQDWETANNAKERITNCTKKIMTNNKEKNIAIIGHGATGSLLACSILSKIPSFDEDTKGTGKYMIIDWDNQEIISKWQDY